MIVFTQFDKKAQLFRNPAFVISCVAPSALPACFQAMEDALAQGYYLAGFFSYESGYCFEPCLQEKKIYDFPLVSLGAYQRPSPAGMTRPKGAPETCVMDQRLNISRAAYGRHIEAIRDFIAAGDVYQVTYCIKLLFSFGGDPFCLYQKLLKEQPVPYPAYIEADQFHILSLSPEMFVKKSGVHLVTKPMKGTWPRGEGWMGDRLERYRFRRDEKNRAENVMIADLLRNDLGRIGTHVKAPRLFEVTPYRTIQQMTSTVTARVARDIRLHDLFKALFPSGSVTGAPKISAMKIIKGLEGEERRIYTGAIGYITPARDLFFNVPIRTLLIRDGQGEMGIGGGIVWDSTVQGEWAEGILKAKFFTGP